MKRKSTFFLLLLTGLLFLTGCSLFPKEEEIREIDNTEEEKLYKYQVVEKGDIRVMLNMQCSYAAEKTEELKFGISGIEYDASYVKVGQSVKKGEVLASLVMDDTEAEIIQNEGRIKKLNLDWERILKRISLNNEKVALNLPDGETWRQERTALNQELASCEEQKKVADATLAEAKQEKGRRVIKAPYAGIITVATDLNEEKENEALSDKDKIIFRIAKKKDYFWTGETDLFDNFKVGDTIDMQVRDTGMTRYYTLRIVKMEDAGENDEGEPKKKLYMLPADENTHISGSSGWITETLADKKNVISIPKTSTVNIDGKSYVYVINQEGIREAREVNLGITDGVNIEVIQGLEAGEQIILQ